MVQAGLEPGAFCYMRLYLTTTPRRLVTSLWRKLFNLMRYPWNLTFASKFVQYDRAALTELLTVKKQRQRISWQRMNKITCALQSRYTSSAK